MERVTFDDLAPIADRMRDQYFRIINDVLDKHGVPITILAELMYLGGLCEYHIHNLQSMNDGSTRAKYGAKTGAMLVKTLENTRDVCAALVAKGCGGDLPKDMVDVRAVAAILNRGIMYAEEFGLDARDETVREFLTYASARIKPKLLSNYEVLCGTKEPEDNIKLFLDNILPAEAWGSEEKVIAWIK